MKSFKHKVIIAFVVLVCCFVYYYIQLPAINFHSKGFLKFLITIAVIITLAFAATGVHIGFEQKDIFYQLDGKRKLIARITGIVALSLILIYIVGAILSSPIVNSKKYHNLIQIENGNFEQDIKQISYK